MRKSSKKAFTIVELVIVIAVVAILAAVLIPTLSGLTKKANNSADTQMVVNINKYLATAAATDGKNTNVAEAMADVEAAGYTAKSLADATNDILWDSHEDRFVAVKPNTSTILAGSEMTELGTQELRYWIVSNSLSGKYPTCLTSVGTGDEIEVKGDLYCAVEPGTEFTVKVTAANVNLYGVFWTLNANGNNPTVHGGYVYELIGTANSEGATFHAAATSGTVSAAVGGTVHTLAASGANGYISKLGAEDGKDSEKIGQGTVQGSLWQIDHYVVDGKCPFCKKDDLHGEHQWELGADCTASTCSAYGKNVYHCGIKDCNASKRERLEMLPHDLKAAYTQPATCTTAGYEVGRHCKNCSYKEKYKTLPALDHKWGGGSVTTEATCTEKGVKTFTCTRCTDTKTENIDALGHDETSVPTYDNDKHWNAISCSRCSYKEERNTADHSWGEGVITTDAKCTESGVRTFTCSCGKTKTGNVDALGHEEKNHAAQAATCTEAGWEAYVTCSRCSYTTYKKIDALGHDEISHDEKEAACGTIGWDTYVTCSRCDYTTYKERVALNHAEVNHAGQAATCTEAGWEAYVTCSRCDYTTYRKIDALGHDEVDHGAQAATCTEAGWEAYVTCSRCKYTTYEKIEAKGHTPVTDAAVAATCTETGLTEGSHCSVCNQVLTAQTTTSVNSGNHKLQLISAKAATCVEAGNNAYYTCERCKAAFTDSAGKTATTADAQTLSKLEHNYQLVDGTDGWIHETCDRGCGTDTCLKAEGSIFKLTAELNQILAKYENHLTMHYALQDIAREQLNNRSATDDEITAQIKEIIAAIFSSEKVDYSTQGSYSGLMIVWDQTIDRFVICEASVNAANSSANKACIRYTPTEKNGKTGELKYYNSYILWRIYTSEHIDITFSTTEPNLKDLFTQQNAKHQLFSIYWGEETLPNIDQFNTENNTTKVFTIYTGFDVGLAEENMRSVKNLTISTPTYGNGHTSYDGGAVKYRLFGSSITLKVSDKKLYIEHHGYIGKLNITGFFSQGNKQRIYEYGHVLNVTYDNYTYKDEITIYAMSTAKFGCSKATVKNACATLKIESGAQFDYSATSTANSIVCDDKKIVILNKRNKFMEILG